MLRVDDCQGRSGGRSGFAVLLAVAAKRTGEHSGVAVPLIGRNDPRFGMGVGLVFNPAPLPHGECRCGQRPRCAGETAPLVIGTAQGANADNEEARRGGEVRAKGCFDIQFAKYISKELLCFTHQ